LAYNEEHHITPRSVSRAVEEGLSSHRETTEKARAVLNESGVDLDISETLRELEEEMLGAANNLEFEKAALLRDQIRELKRATDGSLPSKESKAGSYRSGRTRKGAVKHQG
jgi:excinuclease ABC subunit B